MKKKKKKNK